MGRMGRNDTRSPRRAPRLRPAAAVWALRAAVCGAALGLGAASASTAHAQARAYRGPHPVDLEGRWHHADEVHVHDELPVGRAPFGDVDGVLVFLADPVAYGWRGEVWTYHGAHPLWGGLRGYCGLTAEHAHPFAPEGSFRRRSDGSYVYVGALRGGWATVTPGRTAPAHPVVTAGAPAAGLAPAAVGPLFWFGGCLHRFARGSAGPRRVLVRCPRARAGRRHRARPPPVDAPSGSYFDGRYGGFDAPADRARRPAPAPSQRRRDR